MNACFLNPKFIEHLKPLVVNVNSSSRYRRRLETKYVLEFIHGGRGGGEEGSMYELAAMCHQLLTIKQWIS